MLTLRNSLFCLYVSLITCLVFIKASNNYLRTETIGGIGYTYLRMKEGFPAEKTSLRNPTGVCVLPTTGELVFGATGISSSPLYAISKVNYDGKLTFLVGSTGVANVGIVDGNRTTARVNQVSGLVCTSSGEIYFVDSTAVIRKLSTNGTIETIAGSLTGNNEADGPALSTKIQPIVLAIHPITKEIYFAEPYKNKVRKISGGRIVTVAGKTGGTLYDPDGLLATNTGFNMPFGIDFLPNGELLITDSNQVIRKVKLDGKVQTLYGNANNLVTTGYYAEKSVTGLSFNTPRHLKVAPNGDIYFSENYDYVRKISGTKIYTVAGTSSSEANGYGPAINVNLNSPLFKTFTLNGDLIFSDSNHRILKLSNGNITALVGGFASYDGLNAKDINIQPTFVIKHNNEIYFDDSTGKFIGKIKEDGTVNILAGTGMAGSTDSGIAVESRISGITGMAIYNDEIYFTESNSHKIKKITTSGYIEVVAGSTNGNVVGSVSIAKFNTPQYIQITQQGVMYIFDYNNKAIKKLTLSTGIVELLNGNTYSGLQALFINANQEVIYSAGNYIRKIKTDNTNVILAGTGTAGYSDNGLATQSKIRSSYGIAEYKGEIYFTDQNNYVVRKINSTGHLEVIAGTPTVSGFAEGDPLLSKLNSPKGIFIDTNGTIYIADQLNYRIRVIVPSPSTSPSPLPSPLISPFPSPSPLISSPPSHTSGYLSSTLRSPSPDISSSLQQSLPDASSFLSSSSKTPSTSSILSSVRHSPGISSTPSITPATSSTQVNNRSSPFFSLVKSFSFTNVNSFNSDKSYHSTLPSTLRRVSSTFSSPQYFSRSTPSVSTSTSYQQISKSVIQQTSEQILTSPSVAATISTQQYNSQRHSVIHSENSSKLISSNSKEYNFEINSFKVINVVGNNSTLYFNETIFKPILNITSSFSISILKFKIGYFNRFNSITWLSEYTFIDNNNIYFKIPYFGSNNVTLIVSVLKEATELTTSKLEKEKITIISLYRRENDLLNFVEKLLTSTNTTKEVENAIHYLNDNSDKLDLEKRKELRNNIIENISIITTNNTSTKVVELLYLNSLKIDEINDKSTVSILNLTLIHLDNKTDTKLATTLLSNLLETTLFNNITSSNNNNSNTITTINKMAANTLFRNTLDKLTMIEENKLNVGEQLTIKENNLIKVIEKTKLNNLSFNLNNTLTSIIETLSNFTLPIEELKSNIKKQGLSENDDISLSITKLPSKVYSFTSNETISKSLNHVIRIQFIFKQQILNITHLDKPIEFIVTGDVIGKCVYYNEKLNEFKEDGVSSTIIDSKTIKCSTNHLTDFTIMKTENINNQPIVLTSTNVVDNRIDSNIVLNWRAIIGIVFGGTIFVFLVVIVVVLGSCSVKLCLKKKNKKASETSIELQNIAKDSIV